jgi:hypothetical protein
MAYFNNYPNPFGYPGYMNNQTVPQYPQYPQYGAQPPVQQPIPQESVSRTNKILVTGLEEALMKPSERNTDIVYFDQDKNLFYRVVTDGEGRKSSTTCSYQLAVTNDKQAPIEDDYKERIAKLEERLSALESKGE